MSKRPKRCRICGYKMEEKEDKYECTNDKCVYTEEV